MRTAIARPIDFTTVEGVDRPRRWLDIENALHYDGTYAVRVFDHGNDYQDVLFECKEIPTYAHIHEARFVARAYAEGDRDTRLAAAYHIGWLEKGVRRTESQSQGLGYATLNFGNAPETLSAVFPQRFHRIWSDHKSARSLFDMFIRTYTVPSQPRDDANKLFIDSLHIEFDYTTPPTPWKCLFKLQPDHAIGEYGMKLLELKQGSTSENLLGVIRDATGAPLDLRGAEVTVTLKSKDHVASFLAEIVDAEAGEWRVPGTMGFAEVPGNYHVEVTLDWLDGTKTRLPSSGYEILKVWEALA